MADVIRLADGGLMPMLEYVQREVSEVLSREPLVVVLDLSAQPVVTPTAVAALLWVRRACSRRTIPVVLSSPSTAWLDVLRRADLLRGAEMERTPTAVDVAVMWPRVTRTSGCGD